MFNLTTLITPNDNNTSNLKLKLICHSNNDLPKIGIGGAWLRLFHPSPGWHSSSPTHSFPFLSLTKTLNRMHVAPKTCT